MTRTLLIIMIVIIAGPILAQFQIDKSLILSGSLPEERQVQGLGDPVGSDALVNAFAVQANSSRYALAQGTDELTAEISPAPSSLSIGSAFYILISNNNTGPVTLEVNNLGAYSIKKNVNQELLPDDLSMGQIAHVVFDGNAFQLVGERNVRKRDCPFGFVEVNSVFCIESIERDTTDFYSAAQICGDNGGRLCTWGEWNWACVDTTLMLNDMVGNTEWTNTTGNGDLLARIVGAFSCYTAATSTVLGTTRNYRCCYTR